ncbi:MAG: integral rane sensor signal transduction histidine kinase [Verrucomicrobia bacterium]|nr:integral rane sensor signal transduction histidine kinase [Verrucomicrobiota bacterium]
MNYLTRLAGYSVLLLLLFLTAVLGAQAWLRQQTYRLRAEAVEAKRTQFIAAARAMTPAGRVWQRADVERLGPMVGGKATLQPADTATEPGLLAFDQPLDAGHPPRLVAHVSFPGSAMARLLITYQRVTVGILVFGFALLGVGFFFAALRWRGGAPESDLAIPREKARAELGSLAHLAETTVAQTAALTHERDVRRLAEENAQLSQKLLSQSLEGKVRLGHDLHDGIIQALYAAGLSIESARSIAKTNLPKADRLLGECVQHLNSTIRDVRAYITGLAPDQLRKADFARAVQSLVDELGAGRDVNLDLKIDHEAAAVLSPEQNTEALQIAREAISNSLRHGGASFVTVRLHQVDREVCLLVQDNGTGFDPNHAAGGGFGLGNMRSRASRLGAAVRVESQPSAGTRVILTLPLLQKIS